MMEPHRIRSMKAGSRTSVERQDQLRLSEAHKEVNLVDLTEAALRIHQRTVDTQRIHLVRRFPSGMLAKVRQGQLLQVVSYLIGNALDVLPGGRESHAEASPTLAEGWTSSWETTERASPQRMPHSSSSPSSRPREQPATVWACHCHAGSWTITVEPCLPDELLFTSPRYRLQDLFAPQEVAIYIG